MAEFFKNWIRIIHSFLSDDMFVIVQTYNTLNDKASVVDEKASVVEEKASVVDEKASEVVANAIVDH